MIYTLTITIIVETVVVISYSTWRNKPLKPLLITSFFGNLVTQTMLWVALAIFFNTYVVALSIGEILVWLIETLILYVIPANKLSLGEAAFLSLVMNFASLAFGWFLPV